MGAGEGAIKMDKELAKINEIIEKRPGFVWRSHRPIKMGVGHTLGEEIQLMKENGTIQQMQTQTQYGTENTKELEVFNDIRTDKFEMWNEVYNEMEKGVKIKKEELEARKEEKEKAKK